MEPDKYIEYFGDTILSRTLKSGQKGCYAKVSERKAPKRFVCRASGILPDVVGR